MVNTRQLQREGKINHLKQEINEALRINPIMTSERKKVLLAHACLRHNISMRTAEEYWDILKATGKIVYTMDTEQLGVFDMNKFTKK